MKDRARAAAWVGAIAVLLVAGWPGAGVVGMAEPATAQELPASLEVEITAINPGVARPGGRVRLAGRVTNTSTESVGGVAVQVRTTSLPVGSRSELHRLAQPQLGEILTGVLAGGSYSQLTDELAPGESHRWSATLEVDSLGFAGFGVYPVAVEAIGAAMIGYGVLGQARTFLPNQPADSPSGAPGEGPPAEPDDPAITPLRLAVLWPLIGVPRRDPEGVFLDERLAAALGPGGRLRRALDIGRKRPVTWLVDPELLQAIAAMADGYQVRDATSEDGGDTGGDGEGAAGTTPGTGAAVAREWLADAREVLTDADAEVVALPYADPDLVALERQELSRDVTASVTAAPDVAAEVLDSAVSGGVAWPPGGFADRATLETLRVAGVRAVILDGRALPPAVALPYTPDGRATLATAEGPLTALVTDPELSRLLAARPRGRAAKRLAVQRFSAVTALIAAERPDLSRTVLAVPGRRHRPDARYVDALLSFADASPWVELTSLAVDRAAPLSGIPRAPLSYPPEQQRHELDVDYLTEVADLREQLSGFSGVLAGRSNAGTTELSQAILRTESSAWRSQLADGMALREATARQLSRRISKVYIAERNLVTLTSRRGRFPITVVNDLDVPVEVGLQLTSENAPRMLLADPDGDASRVRRQVEVDLPTVGPRRKVTVEVPAQALVNGIVPVRAQLLTPDGATYGEVRSIKVRATDYGRIANVLTGGALVVLFGTVGLRLARRAMAASRSRRSAR